MSRSLSDLRLLYEAGKVPISDLARDFGMSEKVIEALAGDNGWERRSISAEDMHRYLPVIDMEMNPEGIFRSDHGGLGPPTEEELVRSVALSAMTVMSIHRNELDRRRGLASKLMSAVEVSVDKLPVVHESSDPLKSFQRLKMLKEATAAFKEVSSVQDAIIDKERNIYGLSQLSLLVNKDDEENERKETLVSIRNEIQQLMNQKSSHTEGAKDVVPASGSIGPAKST